MPVQGKGKWERRTGTKMTGTKILDVFLQYTCSMVNASKGVDSLFLVASMHPTAERASILGNAPPFLHVLVLWSEGRLIIRCVLLGKRPLTKS